MNHRVTETRREILVALILLFWAALVYAQSSVTNTKHNLSVSGPGFIKATTETRVCIFCHTPHNGNPQSPLWNKEIQPRVYDVYTSQTLKAAPLPQPSGPTKLCLSCHDGTIAMGAVLNPSGGINMVGSGMLPPNGLANFGLDLTGHHPVSFPYSAAMPNAELAPGPPSDLVFGGTDELHCTTCHDPHDDKFGKFLAKDNRFSALCTTCHQITGWATSKHATSTYSVVGILPRLPKTFPNYPQMDEWGCETCHTPHFAPTAEELLNFTSTGPDPFSCTSAGCHSADPGPPHTPGPISPARVSTTVLADIAGQMRKISAHHEQPNAFGKVQPLRQTGSGGVTCADCHNPHKITDTPASPPYVSGMLLDVPGVDRNGGDVEHATYEYEVCFKCHSENQQGIATIPRVVSTVNTRLSFDPQNESYHPVISIGGNVNVPSIPSPLNPSGRATDQIYCSTCHADDEGVSNGPHGSQFRPILKERYELADNTPENYENYALCYRCHSQASILSDNSFRKKMTGQTGNGGGHSGHLDNGAPCAVCHDPHGVSATVAAGLGETGDHTHLINFDTTIVQPLEGNPYPIFEDTGEFSGTCTLSCHGKSHDHLSYP